MARQASSSGTPRDSRGKDGAGIGDKGGADAEGSSPDAIISPEAKATRECLGDVMHRAMDGAVRVRLGGSS